MVQPENNRSIIKLILSLTYTRSAINLGRRFAYPFIPMIARILGVPTSSIQGTISAQSATGLIGPILGPLSEQFGRKRTILAALSLMFLASVMGALVTEFWMFVTVMILMGIAKNIFDPSMQSYVGDAVPYHRRGFAIGFTELSWALSLVFIAPIAGFLLDRDHLSLIFVIIAMSILIAIFIIWRFLPADTAIERHPAAGIITPLVTWRVLRHNRPAVGALLYSIFYIIGHEIFFINYGAWMEQSFGLAAAALGMVTITIAMAEVAGEFVVIGVSDRLGKKLITVLAALGSGLGFLLLPLVSSNLVIAIIGLFITFVLAETAIVTSISLFTEVMPDNRSIMMSSNIGAHSAGRLVGAAMGGFLYELTDANFGMIGIVTFVSCLIAVAALKYLVFENPEIG